MKTTFKVMTSIFALGLAILLGLQFFIQLCLHNALRETVLPRIQEDTGIDIHVGRVSVNVPNGILSLKGVSIPNPEGFRFTSLASVDRLNFEVDIPSLFDQRSIRIRKLSMENALLNVVCNENGELNIGMLEHEEPCPASTSVVGEPIPEQKPTPEPARQVLGKEGGKPFKELFVEAMQGQLQVRYVDSRENPLDILLDLTLTGNGLCMLKDGSVPWGEMVLTGAQRDDPTRFATDLRLLLAPITDAQSLSFDLNGSVTEIDPRLMENACNLFGMRSAPFGIELQLHCREGWYENSTIALNLRDIKLEDRLAGQLMGLGTIDSLRFVVPVNGALQSPSVDVQSALLAAVGGNLLGSFLKISAPMEAGIVGQPAAMEEGLRNLGHEWLVK